MIKKYLRLFLFLLGLIPLNTYSQTLESHFSESYTEITSMLEGMQVLNFKKAVFATENAYMERRLNYVAFLQDLNFYTFISEGILKSGDLIYEERDKEKASYQCAVFFCTTSKFDIQTLDGLVQHTPFIYNYDDFAGQKDWTNMFVTKMMQTKKGNCHSLPYLYKIIMDELGYESHLALAPNHMYIKANNKKVGWYNIELTCGDFPTDAWYAASGYIHTDAIRNGIYMRALSDKEAVAMTLVDLAQGYQAKFGIEDGSFIIKCCNTALEHFPNYINAMLLKAEILTELYRQSNDKELFSQMTELYTNIHTLGYRKMPQQMYMNWVNSLSTEDRNQGIKAILNPKTKID